MTKKIININPINEARDNAIKEIISDLSNNDIEEFCIVYTKADESCLRYFWPNEMELVGYLMAVILHEFTNIWNEE